MIVHDAYATEGGAYPNGADGFNAVALPPPRMYFLNDFNFYPASRLNDKDGKSMVLDFKLNVVANVFRLVFWHIT